MITDLHLDQPHIDHCIKMHQIVGHTRTLYGHAYARSVQALFKAGRLQLVEAKALSSNVRSAELDLNTPDSILTYEDLVTVELRQDLTVVLHIDESTVSLQSYPSRPRADFHLTGDWWAINRNGIGFSDSILKAFDHYVQCCQEAEEEQAKRARRIEIAAQLLATPRK